MTKGSIQIMTFEEHVRKRPFMYIGDDGMVTLLKGLIIDCIQLCMTDEIVFEINILGDNNFSLGFTSRHSLHCFKESFTVDNKDIKNYFPKVLKVLSEQFELITLESSKINIQFSIDKQVISDTNIDYLKLTEKVLQIALLNQRCEIITTDNRQKYLTQNYHHFPQGIFYLFERSIDDSLGKPQLKIVFDDLINSNKFQIGIAYRTDWYPSAGIISFVNNKDTDGGGSLVNGIIDGLITACKIYAKENNLTTLKFKKKKFTNGLILVCSVCREDYQFEDGYKEIFENDVVEKDAKKLVTKLVLDLFKNQKEIADSFLWRFDTTQFGSKMF